MGSRFVGPDSDTLPLSNGDWIRVRRRLNTGEYRAHMLRSSRPGSGVTDATLAGRSLPIAYLLDWSLTDAAGQPVVIRQLGADELGAILDSLDPDDFKEILRAVEAHEDRVNAAVAEAKKKIPTGAPPSSTTSSSPATSAGPTSTSPPSTVMSTTSS